MKLQNSSGKSPPAVKKVTRHSRTLVPFTTSMVARVTATSPTPGKRSRAVANVETDASGVSQARGVAVGVGSSSKSPPTPAAGPNSQNIESPEPPVMLIAWISGCAPRVTSVIVTLGEIPVSPESSAVSNAMSAPASRKVTSQEYPLFSCCSPRETSTAPIASTDPRSVWSSSAVASAGIGGENTPLRLTANVPPISVMLGFLTNVEVTATDPLAA